MNSFEWLQGTRRRLMRRKEKPPVTLIRKTKLCIPGLAELNQATATLATVKPVRNELLRVATRDEEALDGEKRKNLFHLGRLHTANGSAMEGEGVGSLKGTW
jgi:hypothetical protein